MEKSNKSLYFILGVFITLLLVVCFYIFYNKLYNNEKNNQISVDNSEKYNYEERVDYIFKVKNEIIGKYINQTDNNEYIQLNSDGTAVIKFETGGGSAQINDKVTYTLISFDRSNEYLLLEFEQPYVEKGPNLLCDTYIITKIDGKYVLDVTVTTPISTPGDYNFVKE